MTSGVGLIPLWGIDEKLQCRQRSFYRDRARDPTLLDGYRVAGKREADHRDAARGALSGGVSYQPILRVAKFFKVIESTPLQRAQ